MKITEKALNQINKLNEHNKPLRIGVSAGGCSGLTYGLMFDDLIDDDTKHQFGELTVIIDSKSLTYLKNVELDFEDGLNGSGFKFNNPDACRTCGCGDSFC